jgi:catechol 2,3-dioxygenase-like lactoylglutathione lyase family enzyme
VAIIRLASVSLDCSDPSALAAFYGRLLGTEVTYDSDAFAAIKLEGLWLSTQRIADYRPPTWPEGELPKQVHLDMAVADLEAAEALAVAAGATKASVQPSPERWRVMIDPAGHPFCLSTLIPD